MKIGRRKALQSMGSFAFVPLLRYLGPGGLFASSAHTHPRVPVQDLSKPWAPQFLDEHQNETVIAISELIIPETDTPGAKTAKVNQFIDFSLGTEPRQKQEAFIKGLKWIDERSQLLFRQNFVQLSTEQQTSVLESISSEALSNPDLELGIEFFKDIKRTTLFAYYTSEAGIHEELRYQGNTFLTEFPGCTHPEHHNW